MLSFRVQETYLIYLISISTTKAQGMDYGKLKVSLILQLVKTSWCSQWKYLLFKPF